MRSRHLRATQTCAQDVVVLAGVNGVTDEHRMSVALMHPTV